MKLSVIAVVVTFNPGLETLTAVLEAVKPQVCKVVVVDNGTEQGIQAGMRQFAGEGIEFIWLDNNLGVGVAQNTGFRRAMELGASCALLMDQDSVPAPDMVALLLENYRHEKNSGRQVAALGPRFRDSEGSRLSSFVRIGVLRFLPQDAGIGQSSVEADFLISSGALIPVEALAKVGLMDEGLFVDHVDTEWCLRAKNIGWTLLGVPAAVMTHTLGERRHEVWFLRTRTISFHKPFRYYYIYRNSVLLYKRSYMPLGWKLADFARCLKMLIVFSLMHDQRLACLRMMALGVFHGVLGKTGRLGGIASEKRNVTA